MYLRDLAMYDAVFVQHPFVKELYNSSFKYNWGGILSHFLDDTLDSRLYDFKDWLADDKQQELYVVGLELLKKGDMIEMYADESTLGEGFEEHLTISRQELQEVAVRWRELLKEHPPVITLHKVDGKITLTPRYDIILD
jgi:hypothetical protein